MKIDYSQVTNWSDEMLSVENTDSSDYIKYTLIQKSDGIKLEKSKGFQVIELKTYKTTDKVLLELKKFAEQNNVTFDMFEQHLTAYLSTLEVNTDSCYHSYIDYQGFHMERFQFCKWCDHKKYYV